MPILEVLQIVSQTVGNTVMEKAVKTAATDIERGEGISQALAKNPVFPSMVIRMMTAGEQTGNIDTMLERVSDFLDEEIENTLSGLMSLIEPLLIVVLGVVIGGMVICMFLPIFNLANIVNVNGLTSGSSRSRRPNPLWPAVSFSRPPRFFPAAAG